MYTVRMRRNSDGKEVEFNQEEEWVEPGCEFRWSEGNEHCDCNRHLMFERALGNYLPIDADIGCTNGKYSIVSITLPDGNVVYKE